MKYRVEIPYACFVTVDVEAENREDAIDKAWENARISHYAGNGGTSKLIGVSSSNVNIDFNDEPIDIGEYGILVYDEDYVEVEE
ncbi:MAG: hypothetical protein PF569_06520 [Candidatus Woesearchaeota archaeon]|jgi:hypothetical protein|nr:hypothetical protein [Candidatus Woesearchaeota archaeon]